MSHVPYGYRIENGKAVIDEEKAAQVRKLYEGYLLICTLFEPAFCKLNNSVKRSILMIKHPVFRINHPNFAD